MKKIKIFLASSIEDLREDRLQIGDFFRQLNELYLDHGIHFSLIKCEDYDNSIVTGGKQQEYDREIRDSELVFFLFFRKVGEYTKHEFDVALEAFRDRKKPRIITYFKYIQTIAEAVQEVKDFMDLLDREMKHYYNTYGHIDTLKLGILMQIKLLQLDNTQIKLEDGVVRLDGQPVAKAENVPLLRGNQPLRELTEKRRQLRDALRVHRSAYLADPTEENEAAFFDTGAELNRVSRQLTEVEQETMALLTTVAEMTADGRVLTHRQKEALRWFNAGDYAAVRAVLENGERENELRRAQLRAETAKNEIRGYVEEELLLIKTEKAQGLTAERVRRILASYQKIMELTERHDLDKSVLFDYASFLYGQEALDQAIAVAERLRWHYSDPAAAVREMDHVSLYILQGNLYRDARRYEEAEANYTKAVALCGRLPARDKENGEMALPCIYNNMGVLYSLTQCFEKAEESYRRALDAFVALFARNREPVYEPEIAGCYYNLGRIYHATDRLAEAEAAHGKALEIRLRLAERDPDAHGSDLAYSYDDLGDLYSDTRRPEAAEEAYRKSLEILIRLAAKNPWTYEERLAGAYNDLGNMYGELRRYEEAEEALSRSLEIRCRLAERDPEKYEPELAKSYYNLGILYINTQRYERAESVSKKALEIRIRLAEQDPQAHERYLAKSYNNLGALYQDMHRYEESEAAYRKAAEVYARLAERDPAFEPPLAATLWNLATLYADQNRGHDLRALLERARPLYEKLAQKYAGHYEEKLKIILRVLG